jgi:hypothetical protein
VAYETGGNFVLTPKMVGDISEIAAHADVPKNAAD